MRVLDSPIYPTTRRANTAQHQRVSAPTRPINPTPAARAYTARIMSASPLAHLWTHVTGALSRLRASIGLLHTLIAKERRELRASLRALEAFCRRLAIAEALKLEASAVGDTHASFAVGSRPAPPKNACVSPTATAPAERRPTLRLWPRPRPAPVRIRLLGAATSMREIWRAQKRAALLARLARARLRRKPAHLRLADRIDALQRFLDAPDRALRRLARKLARAPKLGFVIAARRAPASPFLATEETSMCERLCWAALTDSS